jgi:predicted GIY-YIG superfamily endonuclease
MNTDVSLEQSKIMNTDVSLEQPNTKNTDVSIEQPNTKNTDVSLEQPNTINTDVSIEQPNTINTRVSLELKIFYYKKNKKELEAMCEEKGIKGYSGKNKDKLVELLLQNDSKTDVTITRHMTDNLISHEPNVGYWKNNKKELEAMCKEKGIKGYSGKNKDKLIDLLVQNESNPDVHVTQKKDNHDTYTDVLLKEQYTLHKEYVKGRINTTKKIGVKVRLPSIPEDISENIVKNIIRNKLDDTTSTWDCEKGDLHSQKEGKQECKCFTSDGPPSFTPSSDWDVLYFLDARRWLDDKFILYRIPLKRTSTEWKSIKVSKTQTFEDQSKQGRRPRITWESLQPQIKEYCTKVYEGTFNDIFE